LAWGHGGVVGAPEDRRRGYLLAAVAAQKSWAWAIPRGVHVAAARKTRARNPPWDIAQRVGCGADYVARLGRALDARVGVLGEQAVNAALKLGGQILAAAHNKLGNRRVEVGLHHLFGVISGEGRLAG